MKKILIENGETRIGYSFNDLDEKVQEKVLDEFSDSSLQYEWWENVYEDAKNVGLKINEFDCDRANMIKGEFIDSAQDTIDLIKENHGKVCESYKTAIQYEQELIELRKKSDEAYNNATPTDDEMSKDEFFEDNFSNEKEDIEENFLQAILEDYLIMLRNEAEYLSSHEYAKECIEINDYLFDEEGDILPIHYHHGKGGEIVKHTWKGKHECTLTDM